LGAVLKTSRRVALGLLVLYAGALLAFALFHYGGDRPGAGTVLGDFHAWLGLGTAPPPPAPSPAPPEPPGPAVPPDDAPPATPAPAAPPELPTIGPAPSATPAPPVSSAELDTVEKRLAEAEEGGKELRVMDRGPPFDAKLRSVLGKLGEAREILNRVLDASPRNARANKLWTRLQQLHGAVKRL
jgi:hypothetical protein